MVLNNSNIGTRVNDGSAVMDDDSGAEKEDVK